MLVRTNCTRNFKDFKGPKALLGRLMGHAASNGQSLASPQNYEIFGPAPRNNMNKLIFIGLWQLAALSSVEAFSFSASFWSRDQCPSFCLPSQIGFIQKLEMKEPALNSFTALEVHSEDRDLVSKLTWFKKETGGGHSAFQIEVFYKEELIALCTRYEALNSLENVPVGACAGKNTYNNGLLGFIIALP
jgi:hypothetical protein